MPKRFRKRAAILGKPGELYKMFRKTIENVGASRMVVDNSKDPTSAYSRMKRATAAKKPYTGAIKKKPTK